MRFDGTIKIETLVVAGTLLVSGSLAYAALDKRISIVEQLTTERMQLMAEEVRELRKDIKELTRAVRQQDKN